MRNTILMTLLAVLSALPTSAQFHTEAKGEENEPLFMMEQPVLVQKRPDKEEKGDKSPVLKVETERMEAEVPAGKKEEEIPANAPKSNVSKYPDMMVLRPRAQEGLPELTIPNLYEEIRRHGIQYPKIVLAQAILETGWFRSHACRTKNNLFGLTNPRTGEYFEFGHWTESVRAYYTKVQYRYKGGNYLLWLRKIGYAEDEGYIRAVIKVLRIL